jgi:dipeptidyl aminopeptidase/acylaminoacyl peptidase
MRAIHLPLGLLLAAPAFAQQRPALTAADYARAEKFLGYNVTPLVSGGAVRPTWLPDGRFWYRNTLPQGNELLIVDPIRKTRGRAFDQGKLAAALSAAAGTSYDSLRLSITQFSFSTDKQSITFEAGGRRWTCGVQADRCTGVPAAMGSGRNGVLSPDGTRAAFIRDYNLWMREVATGKETRLTTDGIKDFGYATDNAGWVRSDRPVLLWSPDSRKIATFQQDERAVGEMYVVETRVGHPALQAWKYPLPGDSVIQMIQRVVIDLSGPAPRVVRLQLPPDPHRSTTCDHILCDGAFADVEWSPDASRLVFVSTSRDHKREDVRLADAASGSVRDLFSETVPTFFESGFSSRNWRVLWDAKEVLWYSQRDDWGHLYRYELETGKLVSQLTSGSWNVLEVLRVDPKSGTLFFTGVGREPGRDPYFRQLYRIGLDGKNLKLLTPEDADHDVSLSPNGAFFTDSYSRPEVPPTAVVRDATGKLVLTLQQADISRLLATGWTPPIPITVKARDGKTNLYGLMYRPGNFDSTRKYPVVDYIYPGPQTGSVGSRSFAAARNDHRALAELGFIVVLIDGMGTPLRSKSFHAAYYGKMGDNTLPDQVAGIKELGARYRWMDLDRVGIWGHSGGGFASLGGILRYPDFFKVAVSEAGNHDQREYEDDWGEKWQGLLERRPGGGDSYDPEANQNLAKNLKGKLLIVHGTLDTNVPPYNTLLVVNELVKANKDFDLLLLPNRGHGFGSEPYMIRRRWDYFVRHLLGAEPPEGYELKPPRPGPPIP